MADHFTVGLSLTDNSFSLQETHNYGLAMFAGDSRFTFAVLDFKRNKFLALHQLVNADGQIPSATGQRLSYSDFLREVFGAMPWLKGPFREVKIAYEGKKSTLVPAPLFDPGRLEQYMAFNFRAGQEEEPGSDHLLSMDSFQVFSVPSQVHQPIREHFPGTRLVHASSVLIGSIGINYKNRINSPRVFLYLDTLFFHLMIFDGRQLIYFNTFPYQNQEDVTYYLIFVLEQLNFNPETIPLILLGNIDKGGGLADILFRYVRHVEFGRRNDSFRYSYVMNELPPHAFYPLLNFFSCGL
ncbi:MAG: DUF3822 family protein [Bacteroidota bacterium]